SGDDLISGLLLTYNRYQEVLKPPFSLANLNSAILESAYMKTTKLSANLIECASLGQADERLISALDGILAGTTHTARCADLIISWGSSSGCDALVGMALAAYQTG
ncbi:MAG: oxamate carbamoyltransferase subunit AllH family protein, partial [Anaerolineae bacterium]